MYKHPGLLAKHIREGVPWVRRPEDNIPTDTIQEFCMVLWGTCPNVAIPFEVPQSSNVHISLAKSLCTFRILPQTLPDMKNEATQLQLSNTT